MELPLSPNASDSWYFGFPQMEVVKNSQGELIATLKVASNSGICLKNESESERAYYTEKISTAADSYFERHDRYYCIHLKTTTSGDEKPPTLRIHGFFSELENGPVPLEFLKLRLTLSMALHPNRYDSSQKPFPQSFLANSGNFENVNFTCKGELREGVDEDHEVCIGNDSIFKGNVQPNPNCIREILSNHDKLNQNSKCFLSGMLKLVFYSEKRQLDLIDVCDQIARRRNEHSDLTIVTNDGATTADEFPCHKHFLAAQSSVLATMLGSDFEESKTSKIKMEDMSEEGVVAFLDYLYERNVEKAMTRSGIALELLQAGHKYNIPGMVSRITCILLHKNNEWFDLDVAMELFTFSGKVEAYIDIRKKAVQVIKSNSKNVSRSKVVQDFFKANPIEALDLFGLCF